MLSELIQPYEGQMRQQFSLGAGAPTSVQRYLNQYKSE